MKMEPMRLFTIPVAKLWVPETEALKRQFLPEILRRYEAQEYKKPHIWETDRVHTSFAAGEAEQVVAPLPAAYDKVLRQFIRTDRFRVRLWHSVCWTGREYEQQHHHVPSHLTLVHFLSFDKAQHAPPIFYDPARAIKAYCKREAIPTEFWSEAESLEVHEGDALVFPSYLEHRVPPGTYAKPRVTVSMNVTVLE